MLSTAKHLLFLVENEQKQIPRFAQNDMDRGFFSSLPELARGVVKRWRAISKPDFSDCTS